MASRSRKKTHKRRKTSRTQTKRKQTPKKRKSNLKRDILIALALMVLVVASAAGYYMMGEGKSFQAAEKKVPKPIVLPVREKVSVKEKKPPESYKAAKEDPEVLGKKIDRQRAEQLEKLTDELDEVDIVPRKSIQAAKGRGSVKQPVVDRSKRPRLVIIIDDVANPKQLKQIQAIPLKITPSIFPPSNRLKSTAEMAKSLKHYMIHFPMQAGNYPQGAMQNTITVRDSKAKMRARVKNLRKWFPTALYTNNHTGSVFTSDYRALHKMYGLLREEGFVFVDSRTSSRSKGKRVAKEYGDFYLYRDVFIDNVQKFEAIRKQLKIAVKKAKKRGYAIAIGHPHTMTLRTLKNSLDILVDVDVVYLDELMSAR